jgi:hypothetical protein
MSRDTKALQILHDTRWSPRLQVDKNNSSCRLRIRPQGWTANHG